MQSIKVMTPQEAAAILRQIAIAPHITDAYLEEERKASNKGFVLDHIDDDDCIPEPEDQTPPGYYYEG